MAKIVAGVGVPHTPTFPTLVAPNDPNNETSRYFQRVAKQLEAAQPDVILMFDSDHLNTFFLDNMPLISIGVAPSTQGPNDDTPNLPHVNLKVPEALAEYVRDSCIESDFDVALTRKFTVDHSVLVPLHYLTPDNNIPLLPIFINGLVPPLPAAQRCWKLGAAVRQAIINWPAETRIAVVASGSFSLDVGGPHLRPNQIFGVPAIKWVEQVAHHITQGDPEALIAQATRTQLAEAGNVGGELLNWIAMLSLTQGLTPTTLDMQTQLGHGYAFWNLDA